MLGKASLWPIDPIVLALLCKRMRIRWRSMLLELTRQPRREDPKHPLPVLSADRRPHLLARYLSVVPISPCSAAVPPLAPSS
jgi:hypothetical protein